MTQLNLIEPVQHESVYDKQQRLQQEAENAPGFGTVVSDAISSEWVGPWLRRINEANAFPSDSDFILTSDHLEGIPADFVPSVASARSEGELRYLRNQVFEQIEREGRLARAGMGGVAARFIAAVADPAVMIGSGGLGSLVNAGSKAGLVSRALRGGFVAGAENALVESFLVSQDPTRDTSDVLWAAGLGAAIGAGAGALTRPGVDVPDSAPSDYDDMLLLGHKAEAHLGIEYSGKGDNKRLTWKGEAVRNRLEYDGDLTPTLWEGDEMFGGGMYPTVWEGDEVLDASRRLEYNEPPPGPEPKPTHTATEPEPEKVAPPPPKAEPEPTPPPPKPKNQPDPNDYKPMSDDLYERLGLNRVDNPDDKAIKDAWKMAQRVFHPDKNPDHRQASVNLNQAKDILTNPSLRREYKSGGMDAVQREERASRIRKTREAMRRSGGFVDIGFMVDAVEWAAKTGKRVYSTIARFVTDLGQEASMSYTKFKSLVKGIFGSLFDDSTIKKSHAHYKNPKAHREPKPKPAYRSDRPDRSDRMDEAFANTSKSWGAKIRFDVTAKLKDSDNAVLRGLGHILMEEGVGNADGSRTVEAATQKARRDYQSKLLKYQKGWTEVLDEFYEARSTPFYRRHLFDRERLQFGEEVARAVRTGEFPSDLHKKAAGVVEDFHKDMLDYAKKHNLKGFENLQDNPNYLTRRFSHKSIRDKYNTYGKAELERLIAGAIEKRLPSDVPNIAPTLAKAYLRTVMDSKWMNHAQKSAVLNGGGEEYLLAILTKEMGLSGREAEQVLDTLQGMLKRPNEGKISRAKFRTVMDEGYGTRLKNKHTGEMEYVEISELWENNVEGLIRQYTREITGAAAWREVVETVGRSIGKDADSLTLEELSNYIRRSDIDEHGEVTRKTRHGLRTLEMAYRHLHGIPLGNNPDASKFLKTLRDLNYVRVMNQVGFAQMAELGNLIGEHGVIAVLQGIPEMGRMLRRAKNGELGDSLVTELEAIMGTGSERYLNTIMDDFEDYIPESALGRSVDRGLKYAKRVTSTISGMDAVTTTLKRAALRASVQRMSNDMAKLMKTTNLSDPDFGSKMMKMLGEKRAAQMGLAEDDLRAIFKQAQKHSDEELFGSGRRVQRLNLHEWDPEVAAQFTEAIHMSVNRTIQESDIGTLAQWMNGDIGRALLQFRVFVTSAYTKQTLSGIHRRDLRSVNTWYASMFFAGMSYMAQTSLNSIGRADAEEYREKRLNPKELGKAAMQRSGWFSLIAPAVDTINGIGGGEPIFAYGRTTNLATGLLSGNPTVDLLAKTQAGLRGVVAPVVGGEGYNYSQEDFATQSSLIPFQNAMFIRQLNNTVKASLPKRSKPSESEVSF